jgi:hypothetical protein
MRYDVRDDGKAQLSMYQTTTTTRAHVMMKAKEKGRRGVEIIHF